jgi:aspartyl-tRNA(Asn)/glutamyl-tRNA(Gln) amidotransferase subunit A
MIPTIHAAAEQIRQGRLSPVELTDECLHRIDRLEDRVRAWVFVDRAGARAQAARAASEIKKGQWRGPLHGIPLGIKDIFDVFDWPTAAGSRLWKQSIARHDGEVVRKLRQAGAILLGKTVTTQYASFDPPPTRNPWDLSRTPGGSSSGSAAAVALGMCPGALGSQTGGSITRPASFCGVAGCKPTHGRVSTRGVVPLAESMDHVGPMARCVTDLALLLQTIAGVEREVPDLLAAVQRGSEPRVGRVRGLFEERADAAMNRLIDDVCKRLHQAGADIVDVVLPAAFAEVPARHRVVMAVEAAAFHEPRLRHHPEDYDPCIRALLEEGLACPAPEYGRCKDHQASLKEEMWACFEDVDVLLTPATIGPAPNAATTGDPLFNSPWSYTGQPTISLPAALSPEGLPLAIQLIGPAWSEAELFGAAAWIERTLAFEIGEPPIARSA